MNQPLTILQGNIDLIRMGAKDEEQLKKYLERIEGAGDRIAEVVRKIQNLRHDKTIPYVNSSIIDLHQEREVGGQMTDDRRQMTDDPSSSIQRQ